MLLRTRAISEASNPRLYVGGPIPEPDLSNIVKVVPEDNFQLWGQLVHSDPERYAMRRVPAGHWAHYHEENWMGWVPSANHPEQPDTVVPAIQAATGWGEQDTLLYMFNRWTTFKTTWGIFLRHWRHFLWMNDEPLLISPGKGIFLCFGSTGDIGWGIRPVYEIEFQLVDDIARMICSSYRSFRLGSLLLRWNSGWLASDCVLDGGEPKLPFSPFSTSEPS